MDEYKEVTYKHLKVGQEIGGHKLGNLTASYVATVKSITPFQVTVSMWNGKYDDVIDASSMFKIKLTKEEFNNKHREKAKEILSKLRNKLHRDEIGYHEMWNTWAYGTPYEMAQYCIQNKMTIIGYCSDIIPKTAMFSSDTLDVGICGEYEDGDRFWCHFRSSDIEQMFERYSDLVASEQI